MFVGRKKYGDKVKADTMLRGVMQGMSIPTHRESTTGPIHVLPTDHPSSARFACIYIFAYERTICFLLFPGPVYR